MKTEFNIQLLSHIIIALIITFFTAIFLIFITTAYQEGYMLLGEFILLLSSYVLLFFTIVYLIEIKL